MVFSTRTTSFQMAMAPAATIAHRGSRQWQARVRREAYSPLMRTFETKAEAKRGVRLAESGIPPPRPARLTPTTTRWRRPSSGGIETDLIRQRGPRRCIEAVEPVTLEWMGWLSHRRPRESNGHGAPRGLEAVFCAHTGESALAVGLKRNSLWKIGSGAGV
jgi:hypothetical protein